VDYDIGFWHLFAVECDYLSQILKEAERELK
jgi:hypothetical protein